ncbi:MAG TPA: hypothetical protein VMF29_06225 [Candidatus Edwardsbacteria bacterium]|nr:hypothetical protein [Candidatus Edwardsbacteria bacterium]
MKIELTKEQLRDLLALAYLGEWVANAYEKETKRFMLEKTQQKVYALAADNGCGDWIERDAKQKIFKPTAAMAKTLGPLVDIYDENVFWDFIAERLAERDLLAERGHDAVHEMSDEDYDAALQPHLDRWWDELDEHGLDRLAAPETAK